MKVIIRPILKEQSCFTPHFPDASVNPLETRKCPVWEQSRKMHSIIYILQYPHIVTLLNWRLRTALITLFGISGVTGILSQCHDMRVH